MKAVEAVVERVDATAVTVPTDRPEADGTYAWTSTTAVVVRATCGPYVGLGWTYSDSTGAALVDELSPLVVGRPVTDVTHVWMDLLRRIRNQDRGGLAGYVLSAIDCALWDLKARVLDLPLCALLGRVQDRVPVYGSGGFTTYDHDTLVAELSSWQDLGMTAVKIKIGESDGSQPDRDLDRVATVRDVVGPDVTVMVDANGGYSRKQAVRVGRQLDRLGVTWFEEPVPSDDLDGLRLVRDRVDADIAAGEYGDRVDYFAAMTGAGAVDCLQADATRCGGVTGWLRAAAVAAANGLEVSSHCAPYLHLHLAAATPNARHMEYFHDHVRIESRIFDGCPSVGDGLLCPDRDRPGNGLSFDPDKAQHWSSQDGGGTP